MLRQWCVAEELYQYMTRNSASFVHLIPLAEGAVLVDLGGDRSGMVWLLGVIAMTISEKQKNMRAASVKFQGSEYCWSWFA